MALYGNSQLVSSAGSNQQPTPPGPAPVSGPGRTLSGQQWLIDPSDGGLAVMLRPFLAGDRFSQVAADFLFTSLLPGDTAETNFRFNGIVDINGEPIVAMDYDNSVFAGGGSIKWGTAAGTRKGALYVGTGVPTNAGGQNGDFALRTDTPGTVNQRIYVRSAGAWVGIL